MSGPRSSQSAARRLAVRAKLRAFFECQSGSPTAEFAMIFPFLIALIGGSLQLGIIYFAKTELNRLTQDAARAALLGASQYMTQSQFNTSICNDVSAVFSCSGLMISLTPQTSCATITATTPTLTYDSSGNVTNTFNYNGGTNGQIMVLQLSYQLPVVGGAFFGFATQPNGTLLLTSTAVFMNEP